jgi:hypothetical protein
LQAFSSIINAYREFTVIPVEGHWESLTNNDLWYWHIGQVMIVGGSISKERFDRNDELKRLVHFDALKQINDETELLRGINFVLRKAGVRYSSDDPTKCLKSRALANNYIFLSSYKGGLKSMLKKINKFSEGDFEMERVHFLMEHLKFMKSKSARDFLMGLGMNRGTIAVDIRIQNVFSHAGVELPSSSELGNEKIYRDTEQQIIEKVCRKLDIEPIIFDRILYQNYNKIMRYDYLLPKLF